MITMGSCGKSCTVASLLLLLALLGSSASGAHALSFVNKLTHPLTLYNPPFCVPCECPQIFCIRAPCIPPPCPCKKKCRRGPGVVVKAGLKATLAVARKDFPLAYLVVRVGDKGYEFAETDLTKLSAKATVVLGQGKCGLDSDQSLQALVFLNGRRFVKICLGLSAIRFT